MSFNMATPTYKLCIIGESGSGKTSFVNQCKFGKHNEVHHPTSGVEVTPLEVKNIIFNTWDCGGHPNHVGLGDAYYIGADCCFIFTTPTTSLDRIKKYRKAMHQISPDIPIVVVINKCDTNQPNLRQENRIRNLGMKVCSIAVKNNWNLVQPFALL